MSEQVEREVILVIPMYPNMELAAAKTASILAELMNFDDKHIEEIQIAIIETCINAFEHSKSDDNKVIIKFLMKDDALELKITDHGIGFSGGSTKTARHRREIGQQEMQKRGWGLQIIKSMMDEVKIESTSEETTITMIKRHHPKVDPADKQAVKA